LRQRRRRGADPDDEAHRRDAGVAGDETIAASSDPGTARSAPTTVTIDPSRDTSNADPA
jgi:hypothetical protein